jgi:hypothetical protein
MQIKTSLVQPSARTESKGQAARFEQNTTRLFGTSDDGAGPAGYHVLLGPDVHSRAMEPNPH